MAASKPVVAVDDESFRIVIRNEQDGILFNTEEEYKDAIIKLYKDDKYRRLIEKQARITANGYSSKVYAKRVLEVYKLVLDRDTNLLKKTVHKIKKVLKKEDVTHE